jgi:very-short-patch-repair endonuclease
MVTPPRPKALAKAMRREPVTTERTLWRVLRDRRLEGLKFRRQVVIGRYIVDFLCLRHRLIVEADGPFHEEKAAHELERDAWLTAQGFRVLKFANLQIETRAHEVVATIMEAVRPAAERFVDPSSVSFADTFSRKGRREG